MRLANANVPQAVIGGTMRLPSSGAVPPGLWMCAQAPGPDDVVAIYAPLRAIVGGWSGLQGKGWQQVGQRVDPYDPKQTLFRFETRREWFAASTYADGLRLVVIIHAESSSVEGRQRHGFRYQAHHDAPMEVHEAWWQDAAGRRIEQALPQIQLMAPPRVPRISDFDESIQQLGAASAERWAREGQVYGVYELLNPIQQRTPAGRGLVLRETGGFFDLFSKAVSKRYRVQLKRPLSMRLPEWKKQQKKIRAEARGVGLDLETDVVIEWWLDKQDYDGMLLSDTQALYGHNRVVIVFRRAQLVELKGKE